MDFMGTKSATFKTILKKKLSLLLMNEVIDIRKTAY